MLSRKSKEVREDVCIRDNVAEKVTSHQRSI